MIAWIEG